VGFGGELGGNGLRRYHPLYNFRKENPRIREIAPNDLKRSIYLKPS
jgi:hypothetical protein